MNRRLLPLVFALLLGACAETTCSEIGCIPATEVFLASPISADGEYVIRSSPSGGATFTCEATIAAGRLTSTCDDRSELLSVSEGDAGAAESIVGVRLSGRFETVEVEVTRDGAPLTSGQATFERRRPTNESACDTDLCSVDELTIR